MTSLEIKVTIGRSYSLALDVRGAHQRLDGRPPGEGDVTLGEERPEV